MSCLKILSKKQVYFSISFHNKLLYFQLVNGLEFRSWFKDIIMHALRFELTWFLLFPSKNKLRTKLMYFYKQLGWPWKNNKLIRLKAYCFWLLVIIISKVFINNFFCFTLFVNIIMCLAKSFFQKYFKVWHWEKKA